MPTLIAEAEPFVWAIAKVMVKSLFLTGHPVVILDATNTTSKQRAECISRDWKLYFRIIDTPVDVCLMQGDSEINPVINRMAAAYEPPLETGKKWLGD